MMGFVSWYKKNAWLPVAASMLLWVATSFIKTGGAAAELSLAAAVAFAVAVTLLMAVKLADYLNTGSEVVVRQRGRNVAIALALGAFAILFYAATIVRMGANVANRPLMMSPLVSAWSVAP